MWGPIFLLFCEYNKYNVKFFRVIDCFTCLFCHEKDINLFLSVSFCFFDVMFLILIGLRCFVITESILNRSWWIWPALTYYCRWLSDRYSSESIRWMNSRCWRIWKDWRTFDSTKRQWNDVTDYDVCEMRWGKLRTTCCIVIGVMRWLLWGDFSFWYGTSLRTKRSPCFCSIRLSDS